MALPGFLIAHGSALILPLAVIEGPIITVVSGILSAQGYFDWFWALLLLVIGDLTGDLLYYWVGRTGGGPLAGLGRLFGLSNGVSKKLQTDLKSNAAKMLIIGKWTHTVGGVVLVASGMLRLPLLRFMLINLIATLPKSGVLFAFGYFAGNYLPLVQHHVVLALAVLCGVGLAAIALVLLRGRGIWARESGS